MGLYKRGRKWWIDEFVTNRAGHSERVHRSLKTTDKKFAESEATRIRDAIRRGEVEQEETRGTRPSLLVDEYVKHLERLKKSAVYLRILKTRLLWFLGSAHSLDESTPESIRKALARLAETELKGYRHEHGRLPTPKTINSYRGALHAFFAWLIKHERWDRNPVVPVARAPKAPPKHPRRALELVELEAFLVQVPARRSVIYRLAATTGLRRGEMAALRWSDFDLEAATVTVRAATSKGAKIANDDRDVVLPLPPTTVASLRAHRGAAKPSDPVFKSIPTVETVYSDLQGAGIDPKTPDGKIDLHALGRVTFITSLARTGAPLTLTQRMARHSTPVLTSNAYTKLELHDARAAVERLDPAARARRGVGRNVGTEGAKGADPHPKLSKDSSKDVRRTAHKRSSEFSAETANSKQLVSVAGGDENRTHLPGCSPGTEGLKCSEQNAVTLAATLDAGVKKSDCGEKRVYAARHDSTAEELARELIARAATAPDPSPLLEAARVLLAQARGSGAPRGAKHG